MCCGSVLSEHMYYIHAEAGFSPFVTQPLAPTPILCPTQASSLQGLSLVDIQLGPERNTREEARVLFLCVSSCSVLCLGQLLHLFKSGTFAGQPQPAFNGQYMPGSDVFSFCLILPGNRRDLVLWQVSRRLPHLFPQVCQCFFISSSLFKNFSLSHLNSVSYQAITYTYRDIYHPFMCNIMLYIKYVNQH